MTSKRSFIPVLLVALTATAVPALAFDGSENPGVDNREAKADNGLGREEARAIGRDACTLQKTNFKVNKSQFGKCVSVVARSLREAGVSAREACRDSGFSRKPADNETRSDFSACVRAAKDANEEASS
jgi:hypothetical protein